MCTLSVLPLVWFAYKYVLIVITAFKQILLLVFTGKLHDFSEISESIICSAS